MGQNQANPFRQGGQKMNEYQIKSKIPQLFITFLRHKQSNKEFLLREITYNQLGLFTNELKKLQKRKQLANNNITCLTILEDRVQDQMCSNFYKIYTLWEFPSKHLLDDIAFRTQQNKPFSKKQLWGFLKNCANGLSCLQENGISHECLTSNSIHIDQNNTIKVADPLSFGLSSNLQYVLSNRPNKSIYLSPEQCNVIQNQRPQLPNDKKAFKSDVFILALIIIEAGLLQKQDKCFIQDYTRINDICLNKNIKLFGQKYGQDFQNLIMQMTERNAQIRPDWIQLQKIIENHKISSSPKVQRLTKNQGLTSSQSPRLKQPHIVIPPQNTQRFYKNVPQQTIPLPTIFSVSQGSSLPNPSGINISSIPPYSYVSPNPVTTNTSNIHHFQQQFRPAQVKSTIQSQQYSNHGNNFLPVYSSHQKTTSVGHLHPVFLQQKSGNFDSSNNMLATFGSGASITQPSSTQIRREIKPNSSPLQLFADRDRFGAISKPITQYQIKTGTVEKNFNNLNSMQKFQSFKNMDNMKNNFQKQEIQTNQNQLEYIEERFSKGSRYEGYKLNGMRHGQGKFYYQDGGRYQGEWRENKMNGFGRLYYQSDKIAYQGQWLNDQFHGKGKLHNQNSIKMAKGFDYRNFDDIDQCWEFYEGNFTEDLKNGNGKLQFSNGQFFQGIFVDDMVQGQGKFYCKDGQIIHALWIQNHMIQMLS